MRNLETENDRLEQRINRLSRRIQRNETESQKVLVKVPVKLNLGFRTILGFRDFTVMVSG